MLESAVEHHRAGDDDAVDELRRFLSKAALFGDVREPSRDEVKAWLDGWIDAKGKQGQVPAGKYTTRMILASLGFPEASITTQLRRGRRR